MLSTWPAFTEAMYLLGAGAGWRGQEPLWRMIRSRQLILADMSATMLGRVPALMERYQDLPMDLADASLVALAEEQGLREVFTLDRDFRVYRLPDGQAFSVVPRPVATGGIIESVGRASITFLLRRRQLAEISWLSVNWYESAGFQKKSAGSRHAACIEKAAFRRPG